jgi:hypothetical protein
VRAAALALVFTACGDSVWKAQGTVVDTAGEPIEHAQVTVTCADHATPSEEALTTQTGRFDVGGHDASRAMGCALEVSKPGKHLKTVRMMDVCFRSKKTNNYDLLCSEREGKITLE